jgi:RNA polymerase sigma factor (TIGR02999 family)
VRGRRGQAAQLLASDEPGDAAKLAEIVYAELREIARRHLRGERKGHTLQTTALAHEAYLRLVDDRNAGGAGRSRFLALASQAMRRILVDHARRRAASKRGGDAERVTLEGVVDERGKGVDVLALDAALEELSRLDGRKGRIVELRFFGGLTVPEIAAELAVSAPTVEREWAHARAWLRARLQD